MFENIRQYYRFRTPGGIEEGRTEVMVTYEAFVENGLNEMEVARVKFIRDPEVSHEPIDPFRRHGFSATPEKMKKMEAYMRRQGFKLTSF